MSRQIYGIGLAITLFILLATQTVFAGIPTLFKHQQTAQSNVVLLDPGHGGIDGGTQNSDGTVLEKDLNLLLAHQLASKLESARMQTKMTRTEDEDVTKWAPKNLGWGRHKRDLFGRVAAARFYSAVAMVSLHGNHGTTRNRGAVVYYQSKSIRSYFLASELQKQLNLLTGTSQIPRNGSAYYILNRSPVPTVIVEYGYLSNPDEVSRLRDPVYRERIADLVKAGIWNYFIKYP